MDVMFLLVPLSVLLVLALIGLLAWTLHNGQFDNLEHEGARILLEERAAPPVTHAPPHHSHNLALEKEIHP